jgi:hypothetical protein
MSQISQMEEPFGESVGGSNWFSDNSSWSYTDYDSEMEHVAQYYHFAEKGNQVFEEDSKNPNPSRSDSGYHLGEERRVQRNGSRMVLPPRDLSEVSRLQVPRDVPIPNHVDEVAPSMMQSKAMSPNPGRMRRYHLGEERRVQRNGSRKVLPPRDLSEVSRPQVTRDVPIQDYIDGTAVSKPKATASVPVATVTPAHNKWSCRHSGCAMTFSSRNKLYEHLREQAHYANLTAPAYLGTGATDPPIIITLQRKPHMGTGYAFRGYKFAEVRIRSSPEAEDQWVCTDSGCGMTMADEDWSVFSTGYIAISLLALLSVK